MSSRASDNGTIRDDPPVANDWGLVVRVIGGIVIVGPVAVTQDPASNPAAWPGDDDTR